MTLVIRWRTYMLIIISPTPSQLSTSLIHDVYKGEFRWAKFQF